MTCTIVGVSPGRPYRHYTKQEALRASLSALPARPPARTHDIFASSAQAPLWLMNDDAMLRSESLPGFRSSKRGVQG